MTTYFRTFSIAVLGAVIIAVLISTFWFKMPLKSNEDLWQYLASIHELKKDYQNINDPFFDSGPRDVHYGPFLVALAIYAKALEPLQDDVILAYFIAGVFNSIFLIISLYTFYCSLNGKSQISAGPLVFILLSLFSWGYSGISFSGYFSLPDLMINAGAPAIFAFCICLQTVSQMLKLGGDNDISRFIVIQILSLILFITHPLTGIMLFLLIYAYCFADLIENKSLNRNIIILCLIPLTTFCVSFAWPYYSMHDFFFNKNRFVDDRSSQPFSYSGWLSIGGMGILGLILIVKEKNKFINIWVIGFLLISLSYLTPFGVPLYWRFFPLLILIGFYLLTKFAVGQYRYVNKYVLIFTILSGMLLSGMKIKSRLEWETNSPDKLFFLRSLPDENFSILSDPYTSYMVSGLFGMNIVASRVGHENPLNPEDSLTRREDLENFFLTHITKEELESFYKKYKIKYILINNKYNQSYKWSENIEVVKNTTTSIYSDNNYELYKVK
jgi:hypothetical protein